MRLRNVDLRGVGVVNQFTWRNIYHGNFRKYNDVDAKRSSKACLLAL